MVTERGFTCDRCGHCCRQHRVPVTVEDVARLLPTQHSVEDFVELLDVSCVDMTGEPETVVRVREGTKVLVLKHARAEGRESGCVFLGPNGNCDRHAQRPRSCRSYPFDRPEPHEATLLGLHPGRLCPDDTGVLTTLRAKAREDPKVHEFEHYIKERDRETSSHAEWIQSWNRRQRLRIKLGRTPLGWDSFLIALGEAASFLPTSESPPSTSGQRSE